ncbi:hypothetical protein GCM10007162_14630 [Ignatzschineria ureiclastica]|nr:EH signature domain-containing protein [Ignatzschineria ureiclastica]GGZ99549.1 hypothetical protein GCM10007162_14630 [Ignatzschineria ureiclastica]
MNRLPKIRFNLPESINIEAWQKLNDELETIANTLNNTGKSVKLKIDLLRDLIDKERWDELDAKIAQRSFVRALFTLWSESEDYLQKSITIARLELIRDQHQHLTTLALQTLIGLYIYYYDRLNQYVSEEERGQPINLFQNMIRTQLRKRFEHSRDDQINQHQDLFQLYRSFHYLFDKNGVENIVQTSVKENIALQILLEETSIFKIAPTGRYYDICYQQYYLEQLKEIPLGQYHKILTELSDVEVYSTPHLSGHTLGYEAICILLDRSEMPPSEEWTNWIIKIAGDPRLGQKTGASYRYWSVLGEARRAKVLAALAGLDLGLFLKAVEAYGEEHRDSDLLRMFPARKRFLEGLIHLKLVRNARLMMGSTAELSINKFLGKERFSKTHIKLGDLSQHSIIYLDCGDFHLIEGSHNFRLWIYLKRPSERLMNFHFRGPLNRGDLLEDGIVKEYQKQNPNLPYKGITHNSTWIVTTLDFLVDQGISLDVTCLTDDPNIIHRYKYMMIEKSGRVPANKPMMNPGRSSLSSTNSVTVLFNDKSRSLLDRERKVLFYLYEHSGASIQMIEQTLGLKNVLMLMRGALSPYCENWHTDRQSYWRLNATGKALVEQMKKEG